MALLGYLGAVAMGLSLGLIGGGGSILSVPILVYLFKIPPVLATGYSLFVVGLAALIASLSFFKRKLVRVDTALAFAIPGFMGVYAMRRWVIPALPEIIWQTEGVTVTREMLIMGSFALIMLLAAFSMIRGQKKEARIGPESALLRYSVIGLQGLAIGAVSGFVGAGGGFLIVPTLVVLVGLTMKEAIGTSLTIIAANSLLGFSGVIGAGYEIDWRFLLGFSAISVVGIMIGTRLNHVISGAKLKPAFGWFVLVMGAWVLIRQWL